MHSNSAFFDTYVFKGPSFILSKIIGLYRVLNKNEPIDSGVLPNDTVRYFIRGLDQYDSRFGAAFYDGRWNTHFNHAEALKTITCPVLLLHAHYDIMDDGTLNGAMSDKEAQRALSLLKNVKYKKIDASHVVHLDKPDDFIAIVKDFFDMEP